jgi:hypothetical protein
MRNLVFHRHLALSHGTVKLHSSESVQHLYEIAQQVLKTPYSMIGHYNANVWVLCSFSLDTLFLFV